jgi:hypothetical protein
MASPPTDQNVYLAKNFDVALSNIESSLFASTCTGNYLLPVCKDNLL